MHTIDFLPESYREKSSRRHDMVWRLGVVALLVGLVGASLLYQFGQRRAVLAQLAEVDQQHAQAQQTIAELGQAQAELQQARRAAALYVYLQHRWPSSRLLEAVARHLPEQLVLDEVRAVRERGGDAPVATTARSAGEGNEVEALPPHQRDLTELRKQNDDYRSVVYVHGTADDAAALHRYVRSLQESPLWEEVQLARIEAAEQATGSHFQLRLVARAGYGQPAGPTEPLLAAVADRPARKGTTP